MSVMIRSVFSCVETNLNGCPFLLGAPNRDDDGNRSWHVCVLSRDGWVHTLATDAEVFC